MIFNKGGKFLNLNCISNLKSLRFRFSQWLIFVFMSLTLIACQTSQQQNKQSLTHYLNQYVGQDASQLTQHFNLDTFNIQLNPNPIITPERAMFSFDRMLSLPIPAGNMVMDSRGVMIPVQIASADNNFKTKQSCHVIFVLKDNKIQSVSMQGRAC